jgi:hypothetical protein
MPFRRIAKLATKPKRPGGGRALGRHAHRRDRQRLRFVTDRSPAFAAIDPYNLCIDRNLADNTLAMH